MGEKGFFILITVVSFSFLSCVKDRNFGDVLTNCPETVVANIGFMETAALYEGETIQIQEDWTIEGYVVSSDRDGNFFSALHFQDRPADPAHGFQMQIDLRDSHLFFETGSKILVRLKGLYLGKNGEVFTLGGTFTAFGNVSVGRLPALKVHEHIFLACDQTEGLQPKTTTLENLLELPPNTLIKLEDMEMADGELGNTFAEKGEETDRMLQDCAGNTLVMKNSGFSNFQAETLPEGNGSITGVLLKDGNDFQLVVRGLDDIDFGNDRCPETITEFTSPNIFISELADPNNNSGARFVELYNSGTEPLDLNKWTLRRYTNANIEVGSTVDLSGIIINPKSTLVISPNASEFELVYGFLPNLAVSTNSPADSNGDDNLELVDPFGTVIDRFGIVGEDGSNTDHEFEDGRALRKIGVTEGNPNYTLGEWEIYNDTGGAGTIKLPQNAPEDFTPGARS